MLTGWKGGKINSYSSSATHKRNFLKEGTPSLQTLLMVVLPYNAGDGLGCTDSFRELSHVLNNVLSVHFSNCLQVDLDLIQPSMTWVKIDAQIQKQAAKHERVAREIGGGLALPALFLRDGIPLLKTGSDVFRCSSIYKSSMFLLPVG